MYDFLAQASDKVRKSIGKGTTMYCYHRAEPENFIGLPSSVRLVFFLFREQDIQSPIMLAFM